MPKNKTLFITATDTGVGKTMTMHVLSILLRAQGLKVGMLKPVQCAGNDAQFLKAVNPFYAPEPLSPHLAFLRAGIKFDKKRIQKALKELQVNHDIVLVEGAGGLLVPIMDSYYNADLITDLKAEVIIVSHLGLGTINHTLLTINELKRRKLKIKGIIFCATSLTKKGIPESTNPQEIEKLSGIKVLGIIPYLKSFKEDRVLRQCRHLTLKI